MPHEKRVEIIKQNRLCFNCLRPDHMVNQYTAGGCRLCDKHHNTLLHRENLNSIVKVNSTQEELSSEEAINQGSKTVFNSVTAVSSISIKN